MLGLKLNHVSKRGHGWHKKPGHQHLWCWLIDLANWDNYPRTSRVKIKCWKCICTAVELGWNFFSKTLICWILKSKHHTISRFSIYVGIFAWLATKNKSRLKSSDIKFCLIAIVECLVLLVCSVPLYFWTAMPQCIFQVCQCIHELTACISVLCCFGQ